MPPLTIDPGQMFDHELNPVKGWFEMAALDKSAPYDQSSSPLTDEALTVKAGMVISLHATTKQMRLGLTQVGAMPIFVFQNATDFDVSSDRGNIAGGNAGGLVATGGYELETTEFVADTYAPNDPLTVESAGADKGKVKKASALYAEDVVGIVSDGQRKNEHGKQFLKFWPVYLPKTP